MRASLFRHGLNLWPPFLFTGIHVAELSDDYRQARVELRMRPWNRNYVGTHFGGSLFAMTDPFWMLMVLHHLGHDHYVWDKAAEIEFVKPGRGTVQTAFALEDGVLDALRAEAAGDFTVKLHLRFWLCGSRVCRPIDARRTVAVAATPPP